MNGYFTNFYFYQRDARWRENAANSNNTIRTENPRTMRVFTNGERWIEHKLWWLRSNTWERTCRSGHGREDLTRDCAEIQRTSSDCRLAGLWCNMTNFFIDVLRISPKKYDNYSMIWTRTKMCFRADGRGPFQKISWKIISLYRFMFN